MYGCRNQPLCLYRLDRLSALILPVLLGIGLLVGGGCSGQTEKDPQMSRVAAVKARPGDLEGSRLCDNYYPENSMPRLELPPLEPARPGGTLPSIPRDRWLWINLWATWCGPCRREMPLIESWKEQLAKAGIPVEVWYLSVDEDAEELVRFLRRNPQIAAGHSLRLKSMSALGPWLKEYGLEATAAIPIHLIVAPGGRVRCSHVGELREGDYPLLKELLQ